MALIILCPGCGRSRVHYPGDMAIHHWDAAAGLWCPRCYANIRGRENYRGHKGFRQPLKRGKKCMPLKKPTAGGSSTLGMPAESWQGCSLERHPHLLEFLASGSWADGSKRCPGILQLCTSQGRWQGKLRCQDSRRYCFITANALEDLLQSMNEVCETGEGDWRADEWTGKRGAGK